MYWVKLHSSAAYCALPCVASKATKQGHKRPLMCYLTNAGRDRMSFISIDNFPTKDWSCWETRMIISRWVKESHPPEQFMVVLRWLFVVRISRIRQKAQCSKYLWQRQLWLVRLQRGFVAFAAVGWNRPVNGWKTSQNLWHLCNI